MEDLLTSYDLVMIRHMLTRCDGVKAFVDHVIIRHLLITCDNYRAFIDPVRLIISHFLTCAGWWLNIHWQLLMLTGHLLTTHDDGISKVKLATIVEGDPKAPFSEATTPRCRGGRYSFPWMAPLYPWYIPYITECLARRYQVPFLKSLVWYDLGLNPGLLDHWRTLYPLDQYQSNKRQDSSD